MARADKNQGHSHPPGSIGPDHASHSHAHGPHKHHTAGQSGPPHRRTDADRAADRRRLWISLSLTAVIAVAEAIGGYLTGSLALLSDAGHMWTDVSALALSLLALWFSGKPANVKKTYGYYRLEILSALANGVLLLGVTVLLVVEAIARLRTPTSIDVGPMAIVAAIGLGANLCTLAFLHRSHSMNVRGAFLHVLGDTLSSVGVLIAALVLWLTGWNPIDPLLSILIAMVIVIGAVRLVRDAVDVLLEAVPAHVDLDAVKRMMGEVSGVVSVHDLHIWTISSGIYALSAHLVVVDPMTCNNDQILTAVKHQLFDRFGIDHTTIQIESETYAHLGDVH